MMPRCDEIKLLLGPFADGELEPHEMQDVARHVVACTDCDGELADYRSLAVALRGVATIPDLTGFSAAVLARIEQLPIRFGVRLRRYLTSFNGGLGATLTTGFAAAAVAVVTAVILTPYFRQATFLTTLRVPAEVARSAPSAVDKSTTVQSATTQNIARADRQPTLPPDIANILASGADGNLAPVLGAPDESENSGTIISRLEADNPSVAVWSAPQSNTTVIWLPDQQSR